MENMQISKFELCEKIWDYVKDVQLDKSVSSMSCKLLDHLEDYLESKGFEIIDDIEEDE